MIRNKEIKQLEHYCKGLGLKVTYKEMKDGDPLAAWVEGGEEIIIYTYPRQSKIQIILALLHELGHHHDFIARGRKDSKRLLEVLEKEDTYPQLSLTKSERKLIYEDEIRASEYREEIYKTVGLKFPISRLKVDIDYDLYIYKTYYQTGTCPSLVERRKKLQELKTKYNKET